MYYNNISGDENFDSSLTFLSFDEVLSTNDYIKNNMNALQNGTIVLAEVQTKARGRMGKDWTSPKGNIYMSVVYKNQPQDVALFPLLCGLAVCFVLEHITNHPIGIKWPNDVILNDKKLCGILCESVICGDKINVVCGIGVNVNLDEKDFRRMGLTYATSLAVEFDKFYSVRQIALDIAKALNRIVIQYRSAGFHELKKIYEQHLVSLNKQVRVIYKKDTIVATAVGVNDNGHLICEYSGERICIDSGEASVRGLYGYV